MQVDGAPGTPMSKAQDLHHYACIIKIKTLYSTAKTNFPLFQILKVFTNSEVKWPLQIIIPIYDKLKRYWTNRFAQFLYLFKINTHYTILFFLKPFKEHIQPPTNPEGNRVRMSVCCCCYCSVVQPCPTLCDPVDCGTPCLPESHHLPKFAQVHVHCIGDAMDKW